MRHNTAKHSRPGTLEMPTKKLTEKFNEFQENAKEILKDENRIEDLLLQARQKLKELPAGGDKLAYIPELILMIHSFVRGEYTAISMPRLVAIVAALIYFVTPLDVIPDTVPGAGLLDDAVVAGAVVKWCQDDIDKFMIWLENKRK